MPFTPIHMGPGMLVKSALQERFSLMMFGWSQIAIDIQPLAVMLTGQGHLHGFTHTYLGAVLVAVGAAITGKHLAEFGLKLFDLPDHLPISWRVAFLSAFIGTFSHVLLDSVMHADLQPFAPWRLDNPFLEYISVSNLHWFCLGAGILGLIVYPIMESVRPRHNHSLQARRP